MNDLQKKIRNTKTYKTELDKYIGFIELRLKEISLDEAKQEYRTYVGHGWYFEKDILEDCYTFIFENIIEGGCMTYFCYPLDGTRPCENGVYEFEKIIPHSLPPKCPKCDLYTDITEPNFPEKNYSDFIGNNLKLNCLLDKDLDNYLEKINKTWESHATKKY